MHPLVEHSCTLHLLCTTGHPILLEMTQQFCTPKMVSLTLAWSFGTWHEIQCMGLHKHGMLYHTELDGIGCTASYWCTIWGVCWLLVLRTGLIPSIPRWQGGTVWGLVLRWRTLHPGLLDMTPHWYNNFALEKWILSYISLMFWNLDGVWKRLKNHLSSAWFVNCFIEEWCSFEVPKDTKPRFYVLV